MSSFFLSSSAYRKVKHCRINVDGRLYVVGEMSFESLVSLINYYTRNPLYRNVKLTFPISHDTLKSMTRRYGNGGGSFLHETNDTNSVEDHADDNSSYMDPSSSQERVSRKYIFPRIIAKFGKKKTKINKYIIFFANRLQSKHFMIIKLRMMTNYHFVNMRL